MKEKVCVGGRAGGLGVEESRERISALAAVSKTSELPNLLGMLQAAGR